MDTATKHLAKAPFGFLLLDAENRVLYANDAASDLCTHGGFRLNAIVTDDPWREQIERVRLNGTLKWLFTSKHAGYRCLLHTIDEQVVIYAHPLPIEYALTAAFDQDPHPLLRATYDGTLVYANAASQYILETWQLKLGDALPKTLNLTEAHESTEHAEISIGLRTFLVHPVRVEGHDAVFIYFNDVTKTKALNKFPEQNPNPVLKVSTDGVITYANSASNEILARWDTEPGLPIPDIVRRALPTDDQTKEITITCTDRIYRLNLVFVAALDSINIYATDMTAFYELEDARASLIRKEKLAALGSMVAGVAHELNTPIGVTLTASEMLTDAIAGLTKSFQDGALTEALFLSSMKELEEISGLIFMNARKDADLIQSFKGVAVDHAREGVREVALKAYIQRVVTSLSPYLSKQNIQVSVEGAEVNAVIHAGPLSQVITNLLQNTAMHAYQGRGGKVVLQIEKRANNELTISIRDSGVGIAPEMLSRIFEPLFTTKLGQGGSGLGLHICYTTVRDVLKGTIDVESELGEGTTFRVRIPNADSLGNDESG